MAEKKKNIQQEPEHVIRCGVVTASIHARQSNCGYGYWDYSLQRSWESVTSRKEVRGSTFFDTNEQDIVKAVTEASAWIRQKVAQAGLGKPQAAENNDVS